MKKSYQKVDIQQSYQIRTTSLTITTQTTATVTPRYFLILTLMKKRKRNIIWFNPPFSMNIKNNIGKNFLQVIDKHFHRSSKLHKIFNRNKVKVSYSCTRNFEQIIKRYNKKLTLRKEEKTTDFNCKRKQKCPL